MPRVSIIAGGTAGIGLATARALLDAGDQVVITGRDETRGKQALDELAAGDQVLFLRCDSTQPDQVRALIAEVIERYDRIDALVNNVGALRSPGLVAELPDDAFTDGLTANLNSAFWTAKATVPHMISSGYGRIVNISSAVGKVGFPGAAVYSSMKHALIGFTKSLAAEVASYGIAVNAVCPGLTDTEMLPRELAPMGEKLGMDLGGVLDIVKSQTHLGRLLTPDEVAATVAFLASPQAVGVSGAAYNVDGGQVPF